MFRDLLVTSVESTLNTNSLNFQSIIETSKTNIVETIRSSISQLLVPAVESNNFYFLMKNN